MSREQVGNKRASIQSASPRSQAMNCMRGGFVVLDFGSQLTQLITRRLREFNVFSELLAFDTSIEEIASKKPDGIILSGGPHSVFEKGAPIRDIGVLRDVAPLLGICYGMQLICHQLGGEVEPTNFREYGFNEILWNRELMPEVPIHQPVWMSHGDVVKKVPEGFEVLAMSQGDHPAVVRGERALCFQFHPEVTHTEGGGELLRYFVFDICGASPSWKPQNIIQQLSEEVSRQVPEGQSVLCALSGGVDSTVMGTLLTRSLGVERVSCVFVDNGLLRKGEFQEVLDMYKSLGLNVRGVPAEARFLKNLKGVTDSEKKRHIIGATFIDVFKSVIREVGPIEFLAQGTLYPDVIESLPLRGKSVTIKSHHNVGGLPKDLDLKLVEPLRDLFKDEVRWIGEEMGLPHSFLWRHPFPGPGLAVRCLGEVSKEALGVLREADFIYIEELKKQGLYDDIWQAFCVLLPVRTVGVQGDARTYERVLAFRAVTSKDGMTAHWFPFPTEFIQSFSSRVTNEVRGVNRVVYDVTSKPPGTIEWE